MNHNYLFFFVLLMFCHYYTLAQTTYQYDENGNRTARIIDLGKDIEPK